MQLKNYNLVEKNIFMSFLKSFAFQVEDTEVVSSDFHSNSYKV